MYIHCQVFLIKKEEKPTKNFLTVRTRPRPHNCFQRTTGEFEGVLQTPLMPCPAVCCKVSEAVCPYNGKSETGTGKLCFSVSVGVAYGTGQIVTVKGGKGGDFQRKYYPYLDWLKAERTVSAVKRKNKQGFPIQQEAVYLPRRATLRRWVRIYRGGQEKAVRNAPVRF